jgi:hypothetical protein
LIWSPITGMKRWPGYGNGTMMQQWSSSEIPSRDRLAFWVDVVCRTFVSLRCEPRRDQKFFGEIGYDELGPLKLVTVRSIGQRVSRSTGLAASDSAGFYHINIMRTGRGLMDQDGRETELDSGGASCASRGRCCDSVSAHPNISLLCASMARAVSALWCHRY